MDGIGEIRCLVCVRKSYLVGELGIMGQQEGILTSRNLPL